MAFADPQTITVDSVAQVLSRVGSPANQGKFRKSDGTATYTLTYDHANTKSRNRHTVRLDIDFLMADPFIPSQNRSNSASVYLVVNTPVSGAPDSVWIPGVEGLLAYLSASSYAAVDKLVNGEV